MSSSVNNGVRWLHSVLRVKDPVKSIAYYVDLLGFTLVSRMDYTDLKLSVYHLQSLPPQTKFSLDPISKEAHDRVMNSDDATLALLHNHGTENDESFEGYHAGNAENDGFGHLAVSVEDVYEASASLEKQGVLFKKKPV